ncbi:hypothetical protein V6N11_024548 [Hibiscus sabdariffa]|uniref:Uncharacterized protein n=1 Tax=Hibiscus sabdariffa TaxID=183260 RepID=A0ABR2QMN9_9ROSI
MKNDRTCIDNYSSFRCGGTGQDSPLSCHKESSHCTRASMSFPAESMVVMTYDATLWGMVLTGDAHGIGLELGSPSLLDRYHC